MKNMQEKHIYSSKPVDAKRLRKSRGAAAISAPLRGRSSRFGIELPGNSHFLAALSSRRSVGGALLDLSIRGAQLDAELNAWNAGRNRKEAR